jgi:shikimate dehydrogenase
MESPKPAIYLIGHPVGHSLSPPMQNAALAYAGLEARYSLWDVSPAELNDAIAFLRDANVVGANVTLPYKVEALALVDEVAPSARGVGAVNTVQKRAGRLIGHNTDAEGFERALRRSGYQPTGKHVLVLGASGAARAVLATLRKYHLASLTLLNRDPDKAAGTLAGAEIATFPAQAGPLTPERAAEALRQTDLLVNATSVGMEGTALPVPAEALESRHTIFDLVYRDRGTPLLNAGLKVGAKTVNGLTMLLFQGAAAFAIWTGRPAPIDVMRAALDRAAAAPVA